MFDLILQSFTVMAGTGYIWNESGPEIIQITKLWIQPRIQRLAGLLAPQPVNLPHKVSVT